MHSTSERTDYYDFQQYFKQYTQSVNAFKVIIHSIRKTATLC